MKEQLEKRLNDLKAEYASGQKMLADLEARQAELRQTMLRISGAIQVLEELLQADPPPASNGQVGREELPQTSQPNIVREG